MNSHVISQHSQDNVFQIHSCCSVKVQSEHRTVVLSFSRNISYVVQIKLLDSLMYMCTKVEKLTICEDFFVLFAVFIYTSRMFTTCAL